VWCSSSPIACRGNLQITEDLNAQSLSPVSPDARNEQSCTVKSRALRRLGGPGEASFAYASPVDARHSLWSESFDCGLAPVATRTSSLSGTPGYLVVQLPEGALFTVYRGERTGSSISAESRRFAHLADSHQGRGQQGRGPRHDKATLRATMILETPHASGSSYSRFAQRSPTQQHVSRFPAAGTATTMILDVIWA
jgi:hypothetical protein